MSISLYTLLFGSVCSSWLLCTQRLDRPIFQLSSDVYFIVFFIIHILMLIVVLINTKFLPLYLPLFFLCLFYYMLYYSDQQVCCDSPTHKNPALILSSLLQVSVFLLIFLLGISNRNLYPYTIVDCSHSVFNAEVKFHIKIGWLNRYKIFLKHRNLNETIYNRLYRKFFHTLLKSINAK